MRKAAPYLLLIPIALVATLVAAFIFGFMVVVGSIPNAWSKPEGLLAAAAFVAVPMGVAACLFTVPLCMLAFPLAFNLRPPRGNSALGWTLHGVALGAGLAVLLPAIATAGLMAYLLLRDGRIGDQWLNEPWTLFAFLVFSLSTGIMTGAMFGFAQRRLERRQGA